jgi:hypothetical protein
VIRSLSCRDLESRAEFTGSSWHDAGVYSARSVIGLIAGVGMVMGTVAVERERRSEPDVEIVLGLDDGLPDELRSGQEYEADIQVEWTGPLWMRDGLISVYVSRRDGGADVQTDERWPLVCASDHQNVVGQVWMRCAFEAPSPGEFALLLEVTDDDGEVIAESLYAHEIVP